jgi:hypothetical protein
MAHQVLGFAHRVLSEQNISIQQRDLFAFSG